MTKAEDLATCFEVWADVASILLPRAVYREIVEFYVGQIAELVGTDGGSHNQHSMRSGGECREVRRDFPGFGHADVAQRAEQPLRKWQVAGSIPAVGSGGGVA